jgi:endo-1,4-beta-xylanase
MIQTEAKSMGALRRRDFLIGAATAATLAALPRSAAASADESLAGLAKTRNIRFGSAIDPSLLDDPAYAKLILDQCDTIVPRNSLKWNATEASPGVFKFGEADVAVQFAEQHGLAVRGTTLVWYRAPRWVSRLRDASVLSDAIVRHITTVMTRYAGKVVSWDVINEPFEYDSPALRKSVFLDKLGEQYMDLAFRTARAADPKCQLVLNETHLYEMGDVYTAKRAAVLALVDRLLSRGVPIDAIGVQGHFRPGLDKFDAEAFGAFCSALKSRGLAVQLTELDSSCRFVGRIPGFALADYAPWFSDLVSTAAANGKLTEVITWGLTPYGLKPNEEKGPNPACKYRINLFDGDLRPLPTFDALRNTLRGIA